MPEVARLTAGGRLSFRCPGCNEVHAVQVEAGHGPSCWGWNGDLVRPTLSPSVLVKSGHFTTAHDSERDGCWCTYNRDHPDNPASFACAICHSFVREGRIEFLSDCTHALAGQTVELPPWETT